MKKNELHVHAGPHPRRHCPVSVEIPSRFLPQGSVALIEEGTERVFGAQVEPGTRGKPTTLSMILNHIPANTTRVYRLVGTTIRSKPPHEPLSHPVIFQQKQSQIGVMIGGDQVTNYMYGRKNARPYLYPLIGPHGMSVTRSYPMAEISGETQDHPHHKSIWVAHGDVGGGDFWSELEGHGKQQHVDLLQLQEGPIYGSFTVLNDWIEVGGGKVLEETRKITFYGLPKAARMMDFEITFKATEGDVRFGDTKEGGILSVRVASSMDVTRGGKIQNAQKGINEAETWGKRSPWCDYSGVVDGSEVGLAIFDHPSNFRHPTYWHVRNYGLMTANPFGLSHYYGDAEQDGSYLLRKGAAFCFRYRLFVHEGDSETGKVADAYHDWIHPPVIEFKTGG
ncbi:MAG TPA: PmoA family protein [bacterium]|nr:PmoA family protein [bacterium]HQL62841.1 PmoA family protein [bacterium]